MQIHKPKMYDALISSRKSRTTMKQRATNVWFSGTQFLINIHQSKLVAALLTNPVTAAIAKLATRIRPGPSYY
jgi:hypothetical protein